MNERLRAVCEALEKTGWAVVLHDAEGNLVWVSDEAKLLLGERSLRGGGACCRNQP